MSYRPEELFASTAPYYHYRPGYPPALYEHLSARFHLTGAERVLDLGTGTGVLARPLASRVGRIVAVDPNPDMLTEGRRRAADQAIGNIEWQRGDSTTLAQMGLDPVLLAVMGSAFHWMDRDQVLGDLDRLIEPGGALVLASGNTSGHFEPAPWLDVITQVRTRYLGPRRRAGTGTYSHSGQRHQDVLARSAFARVEILHWDRSIVRDLDEVVGLQYSYSYSSPAQLGDAMPAFEHDLRQALGEFNPQGHFEETVRTEAIIATRP